MTRMCLGAREIEIRTKKTQEKTSALLMVCFVSNDSSTNERTVTVSNGIVSYSCDPIDPIIDSKIDTAENFTSHLLEKELAGISVVCDYEKEREEIKVVIRQRLETGIVKLMWSGILTKDNNTKGCLSFLQILGTTISRQHKEQKTLQQQQVQLQTDLYRWKDTATKLEYAWQSEKDVLLEQFHTLYKVTHKELCSTKLALQQLENRQKAAGNDYTSPHTNKKRSILQNSNRVDHQHQPDDQDELIYDMATVQRLAAGPKQSTVASAAIPVLTTKRKRAPATSPSRVAPLKVKFPRAPNPPGVSKVALGATPLSTDVDLSKETKNATTGQNTTKSAAGAVAVASVKDLFKDPMLKPKCKRGADIDDNVNTRKSNARLKQAETIVITLPMSSIKSAFSTSSGKKKPKISASVDEKKRKELELLNAFMDE